MQSSKILIKDSISSEINIHLLPVNIQHNGRAKVSKFFKIEEDSELLLNGIYITTGLKKGDFNHFNLILKANQL